MRRLIFFTSAVVALSLFACAKSEQQTADTGMPSGMMPKGISVSDVAGTWTVRAMPERGDSTIITYDLMATADTTSWMMHLPNRADPIPVRILSVQGDSIRTQAGPYSSALRQNVQVITDAVFRLQDGRLVGTFVAHYSTTGADSDLRGRLEGTRKP